MEASWNLGSPDGTEDSMPSSQESREIEIIDSSHQGASRLALRQATTVPSNEYL